MLCYAYRNTYPEISVSEFSLSGAPFWMKLGTHLLNDPSGQKKVLSRLIEKIFLGRAFYLRWLPAIIIVLYRTR